MQVKDVEEKIEEKPLEQEIQQIENNATFEELFKKANNSSYTICLASFSTIQKAQQFIQENQLENSAIAIEVNNAYKVYHGILNNRDEAIQMFNGLEERLKNNNPYINKIQRLQSLLDTNKQMIEEKEVATANVEVKNEEIEEEENLLQKPQDEEIEEEEILLQKPQDEEKIEENISEQQSQSTPETASLFEVIFLQAPQYYYTIALSSLPNIQKASDFINENNIQDKSLIVPTHSRPVVYYGVYESRDAAINALENLDANLQKNNPYINKIAKPQSLYKKYNEDMNNDA